MKKIIISVFCVFALTSVMAFAQNNDKKKGNPDAWREKIRAEQVAFITSELDLTEAEAQAFWPVYNAVQKQRREAFRVSGDAFKSLTDGLDEGANVSALLDKYLDSKKAAEKVEADAVARYKAVLPVEKVAKLLLAEEKFRHQQIGRLGGPAGQRPGFNGPRPGGDQRPEGQRGNGQRFGKGQRSGNGQQSGNGNEATANQ